MTQPFAMPTFAPNKGMSDDPGFSGRNPAYVRSLRSPRGMAMTTSRSALTPSMIIPKTEPAFPHDVGRVATAPHQATYTFGARPFGQSLTARKTPAGATGDSLRSSLYLDPLASSSKGHTSRRGSPSPVFPHHTTSISNFRSPVGKSTYYSPREGFVNRSYYPLPLGRHTFSSRWTVPNVAAQPW